MKIKNRDKYLKEIIAEDPKVYVRFNEKEYWDKLSKQDYYGKRMNYKNITPGQRKHAEKRYWELYRELYDHEQSFKLFKKYKYKNGPVKVSGYDEK